MAQLDKLTGLGFRVIDEPLTWLRAGYLGINLRQISDLSPARTLVLGKFCRCASGYAPVKPLVFLRGGAKSDRLVGYSRVLRRAGISFDLCQVQSLLGHSVSSSVN